MEIFAKHYDELVGADYDRISEYIDSEIKKFKPDSSLVCDLGCGTASIAQRLSDNGYDMIAIDSDTDMLSIAAEKVRGRDNVLLLNQDICNFELYGTVDVIYCTLDTMNYITGKSDLDRLFGLVRNYLNYDGLFIFDINTEYKFTDILAGNSFIFDDGNLYCGWYCDYDAITRKCVHSLTYFESNGESYERYDCEQHQRYYDGSEINALKDKYGFTVLSESDDFTDKKPDKSSQRITYTLRINK